MNQVAHRTGANGDPDNADDMYAASGGPDATYWEPPYATCVECGTGLHDLRAWIETTVGPVHVICYIGPDDDIR